MTPEESSTPSLSELVLEINPAKYESVEDYRKARLKRYALAYRGPAKGDKIKAAELAGDEWGRPYKYKTKAQGEYMGEMLFNKCLAEGLLHESPDFYAHEDHIPKGKILELLSKQALGELPTYIKRTLRKDEDGRMVMVQEDQVFDQAGSQEKLAKMLGMFGEVQKAPQVNIGIVMEKLGGKEKEAAENLIIEAHTRLLESPSEGEKNGRE